jgi:ribosomal protein S18 acetylase RimI-like enzyme
MATDVSESTTGIDQVWIFDIYIDENFWESQIPLKLLHKAENIAGENCLTHIALQITSSDDKLLHFFKSMGYQEERKRMFKEIDKSKHRLDCSDITNVSDGVKFIIKLNG